MTQAQREKLERWINAYLDGRLNAEQKAQFDEFRRKYPAIQRELELQAAIDSSLNRLFAEQLEEAEAESMVEKTRASKAIATKRKWSRAFIGIAAAVVLMVGGGGGYWYWTLLNPYVDVNFPPARPRLTLAQVYEQLKARNFKPDWVCKDDKEFQTTFHFKAGHALAMTRPPTGLVDWGLSYFTVAHTKSLQVVLASAKIDGQGVFVLVDKNDRDQGQALDSASGLHLYKRRLEHLVLYEVSPLPEPHLLDLLEESEIPQEWIDEGYNRPPTEPKPTEPSP